VNEPTETRPPVPPAAPAPVDRRYEFVQYVNTHLLEALRHADFKAMAAMALAVAMLAVGVLVRSYTVFTVGSVHRIEFYLGLSSYVLLLLAFGAGIFVMVPRISRTIPRGWIFWEAIAQYTPEDYVQSLEIADEEALRKALTAHNCVSAKILIQKYVWLRVAIWSASLGTVLADATFFLMTGR
jgi:hypothetical protein